MSLFSASGPGRPAHNSQPITCSGEPIDPNEILQRELSRLEKKRLKMIKRHVQSKGTVFSDVKCDLGNFSISNMDRQGCKNSNHNSENPELRLNSSNIQNNGERNSSSSELYDGEGRRSPLDLSWSSNLQTANNIVDSTGTIAKSEHQRNKNIFESFDATTKNDSSTSKSSHFSQTRLCLRNDEVTSNQFSIKHLLCFKM